MSLRFATFSVNFVYLQILRFLTIQFLDQLWVVKHFSLTFNKKYFSHKFFDNYVMKDFRIGLWC